MFLPASWHNICISEHFYIQTNYPFLNYVSVTMSGRKDAIVSQKECAGKLYSILRFFAPVRTNLIIFESCVRYYSFHSPGFSAPVRMNFIILVPCVRIYL